MMTRGRGHFLQNPVGLIRAYHASIARAYCCGVASISAITRSRNFSVRERGKKGADECPGVIEDSAMMRTGRPMPVFLPACQEAGTTTRPPTPAAAIFPVRDDERGKHRRTHAVTDEGGRSTLGVAQYRGARPRRKNPSCKVSVVCR